MERILHSQSASIGVTSITADNTATFNFTNGGNVIVVSNDGVTGGIARMTWDGTTPTTTETSEDTESVAFYLNGDNMVFQFDSTVDITQVKIKPLNTGWGVTMVTVYRSQPK